MALTWIISTAPHLVLINFGVTDKIFVNWVNSFSANSEIKKINPKFNIWNYLLLLKFYAFYFLGAF